MLDIGNNKSQIIDYTVSQQGNAVVSVSEVGKNALRTVRQATGYQRAPEAHRGAKDEDVTGFKKIISWYRSPDRQRYQNTNPFIK